MQTDWLTTVDFYCSTPKQVEIILSENIRIIPSNVLYMTLTCSIVQFIMWWCWAVHSSRTCWALWAWEELAWNASGRKYHRTCATGEQLEINAIIQPLAERENTGLTGCFSGRMRFNDRWVAVKDFPPFNTKDSVMLYNNIYTQNDNKRDYSSYSFSFQLLTFSFAFLNKMKFEL